jgi:translation initiation factor IF-2
MIKGKKTARLSKAAKEFNVGISTIVEFLNKKGLEIDSNPNSKLSPEVYDILNKEYSSDISAKKESEELSLSNYHKNKESVSINDPNDDDVEEDDVQNDEEILIRDVSSHRNNSEEQSKRVEKSDKTSDKDDELKKSSDKTEKLDKTDKLKKDKFKVVGKIDLDNVNKKTSVDKKSKKSEDSSKTENQEKTQKTKYGCTKK